MSSLLRTISPRMVFGLGFLIAAGVIATSILYFQIYLGLMPCTLCELQRVIVILLGLVFFVAFLHGPKNVGVRTYSLLLLAISIFGLVIALHQLWLQSMPPDQAPSCGPGLNYLLQTLPFKAAIVQIFKGSAECFRVQWRFLSLSIAGWSAIFFAGMSLVNVWQLFRRIAGPQYRLFHD